MALLILAPLHAYQQMQEVQQRHWYTTPEGSSVTKDETLLTLLEQADHGAPLRLRRHRHHQSVSRLVT